MTSIFVIHCNPLIFSCHTPELKKYFELQSEGRHTDIDPRVNDDTSLEIFVILC